MEQYHAYLKEVLGKGDVQFEPRTQEYTIGTTSLTSVYDLRESFPLMTTKNVPPRLPFEELFWKLRGERNVKSLVDKNVNIWTANAFDRYLRLNKLNDKFPKHTTQWNEEFERYSQRIKEDAEFAKTAGDLGPVYGYQWRHWRKPVFVEGHQGITDWEPDEWKVEEVDQLEKLLKGMKEKPGSRYHILNSYNSGEISDMAIGPCPFWDQFTTYKNGYVDLSAEQRSCDSFLGVPFNIAQEALLAHHVAEETGFVPRFLKHTYINAHIYLGVPPRADFWMNENNVKEFQGQFNEIKNRSEYLDLREWYLKNAPEESEGNEKKDHVPFVLKQLSLEPKLLPQLKIKNKIPLLEAIQRPALDIVEVIGYNPHKWDSKASMAA